MLRLVASDPGLSPDSCETGDVSRECEPHAGSWRPRDGIRHLEQKITDIRTAKRTFTKKFLAVNQEIESVMKTIRASALEREGYLKAELQLQAQTRISEWERQLKVCRNALEALLCPSRGKAADLTLTYSTSTQNIGHVDSGHIEFEGNAAPLLHQLNVLGKFLVSESEKVSPKLQPKLTIGGLGQKAGEFDHPWGVCSDAKGRILVTDRGNHRIQVFNAHGKFEFEFGKSGSGPGEFNRPAGITVDRNLRIIVADKDNHRVQVFSFDGYFLFSFGQRGSHPGMFQYPWDVAVDAYGNIAVSDSCNRRIQVFNGCGLFIKKYDFINFKKKVCLRGVVFISDNTLLVTDFKFHCVWSIRDDFKEIKKWNKGDENLCRPQGIACNGRGRVAIVDSRNNRIQVFDECGSLVQSLGQKGNNPGEFNCPQSVCFLPNGNIVVVESGNRRVQVL